MVHSVKWQKKKDKQAQAVGEQLRRKRETVQCNRRKKGKKIPED